MMWCFFKSQHDINVTPAQINKLEIALTKRLPAGNVSHVF